jgi:hypothetical protein
MKKKYMPPLTAVLLLSCFLISCVGIDAAVVFRRNNSGILTLEYRMAASLESLGKLPGNEGAPTIPVGREDFVRSAARIPGLSLKSYKAKKEKDGVVVTAKLEFQEPRALVEFLGLQGSTAGFTREGDTNVLTLTRGAEEAVSWDRDLRDLALSLSEGYGFALGFELPRKGELRFLDGSGRALSEPPLGTLSPGDKKMRFAAPMGDFLKNPSPFTLELRW